MQPHRDLREEVTMDTTMTEDKHVEQAVNYWTGLLEDGYQSSPGKNDRVSDTDRGLIVEAIAINFATREPTFLHEALELDRYAVKIAEPA
jgi:hypothetical protein